VDTAGSHRPAGDRQGAGICAQIRRPHQELPRCGGDRGARPGRGRRALVRDALDALLPEPLADVVERERQQRETMRAFLETFDR
jgi:hypothetical protein